MNRNIILRIWSENKMKDFIKDVPMRFSMEVSRDMQDMQVFSSLPEFKKKQIIEGTRNIQSQEEMRKYVKSMLYSNFNY